MIKEFEFFSPVELKCKCGKCNSTGHEMNEAFMNKIVLARRIYAKPLFISSAYRCPQYNEQISKSSSEGEHTKGEAIDFSIALEDAYRFIGICLRLDFLRIGIKQSGPIESRFVHIGGAFPSDDFPQPRIWTYS